MIQIKAGVIRRSQNRKCIYCGEVWTVYDHTITLQQGYVCPLCRKKNEYREQSPISEEENKK